MRALGVCLNAQGGLFRGGRQLSGGAPYVLLSVRDAKCNMSSEGVIENMKQELVMLLLKEEEEVKATQRSLP